MNYKLTKALKLIEQGRFEKAILLLKPLAKSGLDSFDAKQLMASCYLSLGKHSLAIPLFESAMRINPGHAVTHANYAVALEAIGKQAKAFVEIDKAIELSPLNAGFFENKAGFLQRKSDFQGAAVLLEKVCTLAESASRWMSLGQNYRMDGRLDEAQRCQYEALRIDPFYVDAVFELGLSLRRSGDYKSAINIYLEKFPHIQLRDKIAAKKLLENMFSLLWEFSEFENFEEYLGLVAKLSPGFTSRTHQLWLAAWQPKLFESDEKIRTWRGRYLESLDGLLGSSTATSASTPWYPTHHFYLAYQGLSDRLLNEKLSSLAKVELGLDEKSRHKPGKTGSVISIAFVSESFFDGHTITKLYRGIVASLDRSRFDVSVYSLPPADSINRSFSQISAAADRFELLPRDVDIAGEVLRGAAFDVIFYTNIGMSEAIYLLANQRFASVQLTSWGHPVTSGMRTIDYFVSSHDLEPVDSMNDYTEQLLLLEYLPSFYYREDIVPKIPQICQAYPDADAIVSCPQSLFKLHPKFDPIIVEILRRMPRVRLFLMGEGTVRQNKLKSRLAGLGLDVDKQIVFLPEQNRAEFVGMLKASTIVLDPIMYGGGNTTYESFLVGTPIVTLPGKYLRARVTYAAYKQMGIQECIVTDESHYVDLACELISNKVLRQHISEKILSRLDLIFEDQRVIENLERTLEEIVNELR